MSEGKNTPVGVQASLARTDFPVNEPFITHIDSNIDEIIVEGCVEFELVTLPGGQVLKTVKEVKYKDIMNYRMNLTHLHRSTYLTPKQARLAWLDFKQDLRKKKGRYRFDKEAKDLLNKISFNEYMILFGDAENGRKQVFLAKMAGSTRDVTVTEAGKERNLLQKVLGR